MATKREQELEKQRNYAIGTAAAVGVLGVVVRSTANWVQETVFDRSLVDEVPATATTTEPVV